MGRRKVIHTLETIMARTEEVGECLEWQGIIINNTPQIRIDRKMYMVRRVIRQMQGRPVPANHFLVPSCGNEKCVNQAHTVERTRSEHMKQMAARVDHNHPARIAKLQKVTAHKRVVTEEGLSLIRIDDRKASELARELGISKSLVNKIRRGDAYREVSAANNPFAGLMRRMA